ncbi:hypothetical protein HELRODRAFT_169581 [Helobdella robusta]|uniref:Uncharacterized protein n=1 Tax=Helobdella robusta TaxID=6412 RepID=T1F247_HELRO|nr:hypothetical protein HELRODRAFT_169581 [Helobdella robusta]ESO07883.1 hypothetical protein HELRODRAFT_169581 [Helobdella robusta]
MFATSGDFDQTLAEIFGYINANLIILLVGSVLYEIWKNINYGNVDNDHSVKYEENESLKSCYSLEEQGTSHVSSESCGLLEPQEYLQADTLLADSFVDTVNKSQMNCFVENHIPSITKSRAIISLPNSQLDIKNILDKNENESIGFRSKNDDQNNEKWNVALENSYISIKMKPKRREASANYEKENKISSLDLAKHSTKRFKSYLMKGYLKTLELNANRNNFNDDNISNLLIDMNKVSDERFGQNSLNSENVQVYQNSILSKSVQESRIEHVCSNNPHDVFVSNITSNEENNFCENENIEPHQQNVPVTFSESGSVPLGSGERDNGQKENLNIHLKENRTEFGSGNFPPTFKQLSRLITVGAKRESLINEDEYLTIKRFANLNSFHKFIQKYEPNCEQQTDAYCAFLNMPQVANSCKSLKIGKSFSDLYSTNYTSSMSLSENTLKNCNFYCKPEFCTTPVINNVGSDLYIRSLNNSYKSSNPTVQLCSKTFSSPVLPLLPFEGNAKISNKFNFQNILNKKSNSKFLPKISKPLPNYFSKINPDKHLISEKSTFDKLHNSFPMQKSLKTNFLSDFKESLDNDFNVLNKCNFACLNQFKSCIEKLSNNSEAETTVKPVEEYTRVNVPVFKELADGNVNKIKKIFYASGWANQTDLSMFNVADDSTGDQYDGLANMAGMCQANSNIEPAYAYRDDKIFASKSGTIIHKKIADDNSNDNFGSFLIINEISNLSNKLDKFTTDDGANAKHVSLNNNAPPFFCKRKKKDRNDKNTIINYNDNRMIQTDLLEEQLDVNHQFIPVENTAIDPWLFDAHNHNDDDDSFISSIRKMLSDKHKKQKSVTFTKKLKTHKSNKNVHFKSTSSIGSSISKTSNSNDDFSSSRKRSDVTKSSSSDGQKLCVKKMATFCQHENVENLTRSKNKKIGLNKLKFLFKWKNKLAPKIKNSKKHYSNIELNSCNCHQLEYNNNFCESNICNSNSLFDKNCSNKTEMRLLISGGNKRSLTRSNNNGNDNNGYLQKLSTKTSYKKKVSKLQSITKGSKSVEKTVVETSDISSVEKVDTKSLLSFQTTTSAWTAESSSAVISTRSSDKEKIGNKGSSSDKEKIGNKGKHHSRIDNKKFNQQVSKNASKRKPITADQHDGVSDVLSFETYSKLSSYESLVSYESNKLIDFSFTNKTSVSSDLTFKDGDSSKFGSVTPNGNAFTHSQSLINSDCYRNKIETDEKKKAAQTSSHYFTVMKNNKRKSSIKLVSINIPNSVEDSKNLPAMIGNYNTKSFNKRNADKEITLNSISSITSTRKDLKMSQPVRDVVIKTKHSSVIQLDSQRDGKSVDVCKVCDLKSAMKRITNANVLSTETSKRSINKLFAKSDANSYVQLNSYEDSAKKSNKRNDKFENEHANMKYVNKSTSQTRNLKTSSSGYSVRIKYQQHLQQEPKSETSTDLQNIAGNVTVMGPDNNLQSELKSGCQVEIDSSIEKVSEETTEEEEFVKTTSFLSNTNLGRKLSSLDEKNIANEGGAIKSSCSFVCSNEVAIHNDSGRTSKTVLKKDKILETMTSNMTNSLKNDSESVDNVLSKVTPVVTGRSENDKTTNCNIIPDEQLFQRSVSVCESKCNRDANAAGEKCEKPCPKNGNFCYLNEQGQLKILNEISLNNSCENDSTFTNFSYFVSNTNDSTSKTSLVGFANKVNIDDSVDRKTDSINSNKRSYVDDNKAQQTPLTLNIFLSEEKKSPVENISSVLKQSKSNEQIMNPSLGGVSDCAAINDFVQPITDTFSNVQIHAEKLSMNTTKQTTVNSLCKNDSNFENFTAPAVNRFTLLKSQSQLAFSNSIKPDSLNKSKNDSEFLIELVEADLAANSSFSDSRSKVCNNDVNVKYESTFNLVTSSEGGTLSDGLTKTSFESGLNLAESVTSFKRFVMSAIKKSINDSLITTYRNDNLKLLSKLLSTNARNMSSSSYDSHTSEVFSSHNNLKSYLAVENNALGNRSLSATINQNNSKESLINMVNLLKSKLKIEKSQVECFNTRKLNTYSRKSLKSKQTEMSENYSKKVEKLDSKTGEKGKQSKDQKINECTTSYQACIKKKPHKKYSSHCKPDWMSNIFQCNRYRRTTKSVQIASKRNKPFIRYNRSLTKRSERANSVCFMKPSMSIKKVPLSSRKCSQLRNLEKCLYEALKTNRTFSNRDDLTNQTITSRCSEIKSQLFLNDVSTLFLKETNSQNKFSSKIELFSFNPSKSKTELQKLSSNEVSNSVNKKVLKKSAMFTATFQNESTKQTEDLQNKNLSLATFDSSQKIEKYAQICEPKKFNSKRQLMREIERKIENYKKVLSSIKKDAMSVRHVNCIVNELGPSLSKQLLPVPCLVMKPRKKTYDKLDKSSNQKSILKTKSYQNIYRKTFKSQSETKLICSVLPRKKIVDKLCVKQTVSAHRREEPSEKLYKSYHLSSEREIENKHARANSLKFKKYVPRQCTKFGRNMGPLMITKVPFCSGTFKLLTNGEERLNISKDSEFFNKNDQLGQKCFFDKNKFILKNKSNHSKKTINNNTSKIQADKYLHSTAKGQAKKRSSNGKCFDVDNSRNQPIDIVKDSMEFMELNLANIYKSIISRADCGRNKKINNSALLDISDDVSKMVELGDRTPSLRSLAPSLRDVRQLVELKDRTLPPSSSLLRITNPNEIKREKILQQSKLDVDEKLCEQNLQDGAVFPSKTSSTKVKNKRRSGRKKNVLKENHEENFYNENAKQTLIEFDQYIPSTELEHLQKRKHKKCKKSHKTESKKSLTCQKPLIETNNSTSEQVECLKKTKKKEAKRQKQKRIKTPPPVEDSVVKLFERPKEFVTELFNCVSNSLTEISNQLSNGNEIKTLLDEPIMEGQKFSFCETSTENEIPESSNLAVVRKISASKPCNDVNAKKTLKTSTESEKFSEEVQLETNKGTNQNSIGNAMFNNDNILSHNVAYNPSKYYEDEKDKAQHMNGNNFINELSFQKSAKANIIKRLYGQQIREQLSRNRGGRLNLQSREHKLANILSKVNSKNNSNQNVPTQSSWDTGKKKFMETISSNQSLKKR